VSLNLSVTRVQNWREVCYERFTGTHDEMDERVRQCTMFGSGWSWTDDTETEIMRWHPTTWTLAFVAMGIGMGEITEDNGGEWLRRLNVMEATYGAFRRDGDGNDVPFTADEIRAHVGLRVNVAPESARSFNARMKKIQRERDARAATVLGG
jgi:hypothetical protein